jgi:peptide/nickel transport system substrate-binding protein
VEFTILTNQGNRMREQAATIIQSQLQEIGITVKIRIIAWSSLLSEFINKRQFEAVVMGWALAQDPDPYNIWHSSQTGEHEFNFVSYANPKVDALIERGRRIFNHRERQTIYQEIHQRIADDLPYVFLYVPDNLPVVHRRVLGIKPALAGIGYNFNEWYVPEGFVRYAQ